MRKLLVLLKVQLLGFFSLGKMLRSTGRKLKLYLAGFLLLLLGLSGLFGWLSYKVSALLADAGLSGVLPPMLLTLCALLSLVTTILKANGLLFGYRDYDQVMSLPVPVPTVIASRLLTLYLTTLALDAVIFLPGAAVYALHTGGGVSAWAMLVLGLLLGPLLPIAVGSLIALLLSALLSRLPLKNLWLTLLSFVFFFGVMWLSVWMQTVSPLRLAAMGEMVLRQLYAVYPPMQLFGRALVEGSWGAMGLFAAVSLGAAALFVLLFALGFRRINTLLTTRRHRAGYRLGAQKQGKPLGALYRCELRRYVSSSVYVLNTGIGAVIMIVLGVASFAWQGSQIHWALTLIGYDGWLGDLAALLPAFLLGISSTTSCSLSLDGPVRWVLYSSPVHARTIFHAKILLNLTVTLPAALIGCPLLAYNLRLTAAQTAMLLASALVWALYAAVVGLWLNLRMPQYDWTNPYTVMKRSLPVFVAVIGNMLLVTAIGFAAVFLERTALVVWAGTALIAALVALCYLSLCRARLSL